MNRKSKFNKKCMARSAGITFAAICIGVATLTTPAHAKETFGCPKKYLCFWVKPMMEGPMGKGEAPANVCVNISTGVNSAKNRTGKIVMVFSKRNCQGKQAHMVANEGFTVAPFAIRSYHG